MPAAPTWDETLPVEPVAASVPSWDDTTEIPSVSGLESAGRGLLQGGSLGFSDELYGGGAALVDALKKGTLDDFGDTYTAERDAVRKANKAAEEANPNAYLGGNIAGGVATAFVPGLNIGKVATLGGRAALAAGLGAGAGLGNSEADLTKGEVGRAALDTAVGGALGAGLQVGGEKLVAPAIRYVGEKISSVAPSRESVARFLGGKAAELAENATGATAKQAEKFAGAPGETGRELLDRGIVRFGDSARNIANRADDLMTADGQSIGNALKALDEKGVTVSKSEVLDALTQKIYELRKDPSQNAVVKQLLNIAEAIEAAPTGDPLISAAEQTKRGFQAAVKGGWNDPTAQVANKAAAGVYREAVETAATKADPALSKALTQSKKQYGLLAPVQEAASRRAGQLNQAQFGGLLDVAAGTFGALTGNDYQDSSARAVLFAGARRALAPRLAASGAVALDKVSKALISNPSVLGKFAAPLAQAATRGNKALAATQYILQQRDPEFQEMKKQLEEQGE